MERQQFLLVYTSSLPCSGGCSGYRRGQVLYGKTDGCRQFGKQLYLGCVLYSFRTTPMDCFNVIFPPPFFQVANKAEGGYLATFLAVVMGDFSGRCARCQRALVVITEHHDYICGPTSLMCLTDLVSCLIGFLGITAPLSAFIGDCCLYTLTICLVTATCQSWYGNDSQAINDEPNLGSEL